MYREFIWHWSSESEIQQYPESVSESELSSPAEILTSVIFASDVINALIFIITRVSGPRLLAPLIRHLISWKAITRRLWSRFIGSRRRRKEERGEDNCLKRRRGKTKDERSARKVSVCVNRGLALEWRLGEREGNECISIYHTGEDYDLEITFLFQGEECCLSDYLETTLDEERDWENRTENRG